MALLRPPFLAEKEPDETVLVEPGSTDDPPIGAELRAAGIRWDHVIAIYMRMMAALWLIKGLMFWGMIIGLGDLPLVQETRLKQGAIVFFGLIDCVAAVGLWLLANWGRSVWLIAIAFEVLIGLFGGIRLAGIASPFSVIFSVLCYFALVFAFKKQKF